MIEWIKDRWLTWRTGKDKDTREWETWYEVNVVYRAQSINNMFMHFKHVIEVDHNKFMVEDPFTWHPCEDARQYFWPARPLGNNAVWRFERVYWNQWQQEWICDEMGGEDKVFVATNSDEDATMIALKYT